MDLLPMMFSRSYPLDALEFKRDHYFDAHVANTIPASSGTEHITSVCYACTELCLLLATQD